MAAKSKTAYALALIISATSATASGGSFAGERTADVAERAGTVAGAALACGAMDVADYDAKVERMIREMTDEGLHQRRLLRTYNRAADDTFETQSRRRTAPCSTVLQLYRGDPLWNRP